MKMKTFETNNAETRDQVCNEFEQNHKVKATQTGIIQLTTNKLLYWATMFYEEQ